MSTRIDGRPALPNSYEELYPVNCRLDPVARTHDAVHDWLAPVEDESPSGAEVIHPDEWRTFPAIGVATFPGLWAEVDQHTGANAEVKARALNVLAAQRTHVPWIWRRA